MFKMIATLFVVVTLSGCASTTVPATVEFLLGEPEEWNAMLDTLEEYTLPNEGERGAPQR